ncbi:heterokaryon incompatibility protein-domain-containing protein [Pyrenochaeta sp. MPI-SDFR-AT-0127]|nr:heterokaryon incompatibility protein-domain-containing protein [Pyrenochaeta sp. MPI-SDFR-AT-0127]
MDGCPVCHDFDGTKISQADEAQAWHEKVRDGEEVDKKNFHFRADMKSLFVRGQLGCNFCQMLLNGIMKFESKWKDIAEENLHIFVNFHTRNGLTLQMIVNDGTGKLETGMGLEFFVAEDELSFMNWGAMRIMREIEGDPVSQRTLSRATTWIDECIDIHAACKLSRTVNLPKRVVDVGITKRFEDPILYETAGENARYLALSHCWGREPILTTTKATLEEHKSKIKWDNLSQNFKDAVMVARSLSIRYLWIDSLCIVQDDDQDWQKQAAEMGNIYEGAYLTIAATRASDASKGFLWRRPGSAYVSTTIPPFKVRVRPIIPHFGSAIQDSLAGYAGPNPHPLLARAWCFQERLLSIRILHFTSSEIMFECRSGSHCECNDRPQLRDQPFKKLFGKALKYLNDYELQVNDLGGIPKDLEQFWFSMLFAYHRTEITYPKDILPALSAIASRMPSSLLGTYHAGLWSNTLPLSLCWHSPTISCRRPSNEYLSPTFSWASRVGPVMTMLSYVTEYTIDAQLLGIQTTPKSFDPFGAVASGYVRLLGKVMSATFDKIVADGSNSGNCRLERNDKEGFFWADSKDDAISYEKKKVVCLKILTSKSLGYVVALVLIPDRNVKTFYTRIGLAHLDPGWFDGVKDSGVAIF